MLFRKDQMKTISLLAASLLLAACSVTYGPRIPGFVPGYADTRLGENTYQVKIGEAWPKDWPDLEKFAMYRAADITQNKGFRYFVVTNASTQTSNYLIRSPAVTKTVGSVHGIGNSAVLNATSTTTGGVTSTISGGWYILDFKILNNSEVSNYEKVMDSNTIKSDLKYFIESRKR
jgi:hypothetical protein